MFQDDLFPELTTTSGPEEVAPDPSEKTDKRTDGDASVAATAEDPVKYELKLDNGRVLQMTVAPDPPLPMKPRVLDLPSIRSATGPDVIPVGADDDEGECAKHMVPRGTGVCNCKRYESTNK